MFALSSIGGTVYAAQDSLPDDLLYPVKILTEDIQIGLESDPEDRLDLYASFANRWLEEIEAQILAGGEISDKALARLEKLSEMMLQQAAPSGRGGQRDYLPDAGHCVDPSSLNGQYLITVKITLVVHL